MSKKAEFRQENNLLYKISQEKRVVKCTIYAHGVFFTGVAKCDQRDEFDVDYGKRLAYLRAIRKMKIGEIRAVCAYIEQLKKLPTIAELEDKVNYLQKGVENLNTKIADQLALKQ